MQDGVINTGHSRLHVQQPDFCFGAGFIGARSLIYRTAGDSKSESGDTDESISMDPPSLTLNVLRLDSWIHGTKDWSRWETLCDQAGCMQIIEIIYKRYSAARTSWNSCRNCFTTSTSSSTSSLLVPRMNAIIPRRAIQNPRSTK